MKQLETRSLHVLPYKHAMEQLGLDPLRLPDTISISRDNLRWLLKVLLRGVDVDDEWYRTTYPDVDNAIRQGACKSSKQHFVENGYFEGRRPGRVVVDEDWYRRAYPDIVDGISLGEIASCQEHFDNHGEIEGRLPQEY